MIRQVCGDGLGCMTGEHVFASTQLKSQLTKGVAAIGAALAFVVGSGPVANAQVHSFAANPQHTSQYAPTAQRLNRIKWSATINDNLTGGFAHYGAPLVTAGNTVVIANRTATNGFEIKAFDGNTGTLKWTLTGADSDYVQPPGVSWLIPVQPVITTGVYGTRLFYPGAGGTIFRLDDPDSNSPAAPTRIGTVTANVYVNTPITADSNDNLFYGTRIEPAGTQSTIVRIDGSTFAATSVNCDTASGIGTVSRVTHGSAIAMSNDEASIYLAVKGTSSVTSPYLLRLNATTLATEGSVLLKDPRNGLAASITDVSTSSPMVAPDNDVYFGVQANPYNGSRGWLLRFNSDLTVEKTPGGFGWDYTPGLIPASAVPSYTGTSTYLLFCKYNNYAINDGNGVNTVAIVDPNSTQIDFHTSAPNQTLMRNVFTMIGPAPDEDYPTVMGAVREWCINASAVNVAKNSVYFNCEDGHLYRWDLTTNSLSESIQLNSGIGQPYVPTIIGPDGTLFTLNGGYLFAIGDYDDVSVALTSSAPDVRTTVTGDSITFTATVANPNGGVWATPTGTITFEKTTIENHIPVTTTMATVPLDGSGVATYSVALDGGSITLGDHWGNYRIKAIYSGDLNYPAGEAKLYQKVHAFATTTSLGATGTFAPGDPVTFTATVTAVPGGSGTPSGYVTFYEAGVSLAQIPLDGSGQASFTTSSLSMGSHTVNAVYDADTWFATSSDSEVVSITASTSTSAGSSPNPSTFGQSVALTATVTSGSGTPAGSVEFFDGVTSLGTASVNGSGVATLNTSSLSVGSHTIGATFTGSSGWGGSSALTFSHSVTQGTSTVVGTSPNPSFSGGSVTITATVTATAGGTPTGSVEFFDGVTSLGTVAVNGSGVASMSTSSLSNGSHTISGNFTGTGGWGDSSGNTSHTVASGNTTTTVTSTPNPSYVGQSVTFTATVANVGGGGTPTGSVTFTEGPTNFGTIPLNGSGQASFNTSSLSAGAHTIVGTYNPTGGWQTSNGNRLQTVNNDTTPPSVPSGLTATSGAGQGQVTLNWNASTDVGGTVAYYEVWRSTRINGTFTLRGTTTTTTYVDNPGRKKKMFYYVVAVDTSGNRSGNSAVVQGIGATRGTFRKDIIITPFKRG